MVGRRSINGIMSGEVHPNSIYFLHNICLVSFSQPQKRRVLSVKPNEKCCFGQSLEPNTKTMHEFLLIVISYVLKRWTKLCLQNILCGKDCLKFNPFDDDIEKPKLTLTEKRKWSGRATNPVVLPLTYKHETFLTSISSALILMSLLKHLQHPSWSIHPFW